MTDPQAIEQISDERLAEHKPWPLLGYAPGSYACRCSICSRVFTGDKRASMCLECAAQRARELLSRRATPASGVSEALRDCIQVLTADTIGTTDMDNPEWYAAVNAAVAKARAALTASSPAPVSGEAVGRVYLIRKSGAWYRPNSSGYTTHVAEAGRYTLTEAEAITHPNGPDGPRDSMSYAHQDEVAAPAQPTEGEVEGLIKRLRADNDWLVNSRLVGHELRALQTCNNILEAVDALRSRPTVSPPPVPGVKVANDPHRFAVVSADYARPFLLGAYPALENAIKAQCGSPEKWHIFERLSALNSQARDLVLEEGSPWFKLSGDARLGRCATEGCGGQPTWRLEAGGVGSNYCSGCTVDIRAFRRQASPEAGEVGK